MPAASPCAAIPNLLLTAAVHQALPRRDRPAPTARHRPALTAPTRRLTRQANHSALVEAGTAIDIQTNRRTGNATGYVPWFTRQTDPRNCGDRRHHPLGPKHAGSIAICLVGRSF